MPENIILFIASRSSKKTPDHKRVSISSYDVRPQISSINSQFFYRSAKSSMQMQAVIALYHGLKYLANHNQNSNAITIIANTTYLKHIIDGKLKYWEKHHWISQRHSSKGGSSYKKIPQSWIGVDKYLKQFPNISIKTDRHNEHIKEMRKSLLNHLTGQNKEPKPDKDQNEINQMAKAVARSSREAKDNSQDLQQITDHSFDEPSNKTSEPKLSALKEQIASLRNKLNKARNNHGSVQKLHKKVRNLKQLSSTLQSRIKDDIKSMAEADKKIKDNKQYKSRYYDVSSRNKSLVENNRKLAKVINDFKQGRIIIDHDKNLWRLL